MCVVGGSGGDGAPQRAGLFDAVGVGDGAEVLRLAWPGTLTGFLAPQEAEAGGSGV